MIDFEMDDLEGKPLEGEDQKMYLPLHFFEDDNILRHEVVDKTFSDFGSQQEYGLLENCEDPIYDTCSDVYSEGIVSIERAMGIFPL